MAQAIFSIGIDLGTSNSVLAFSPLTGEGKSEVLAVPQWDTASTVTDSFTLPSFLYLRGSGRHANPGPWPQLWRVGHRAARPAQGQRNARARRTFREVLAMITREIVSVSDCFLKKGDVVTDNNGASIIFVRNIEAPPLHEGCRCYCRPDGISSD
jgi:molecular chaperone DnaK (HSP70)